MNQKNPMTPERNRNTKPRMGNAPQDRQSIYMGRVDDIPEEPQLRRRPESLAEEERRAGIATVVFSVTVAAVALLVCLLVAVMTVRTALPSHGNGKPNGTNAGTTELTPSDPGSILFTPGAAVLPKSGTNTKSISGINSNYAVLVDAQTGEILAGKDADTRFSPASMTKVMTLLVACENLKEGDLSQNVTNTEEIHNYVRAGKYRGLTVHWADVGDGAKLSDQLYGIGVVSAADCVMMVASYICKKATPAENEAAFVDLMNAEVEKMGLQNTHFDNPVGYDSENNYSTASDMAAIMMRALQCELIREILSTQSRKFSAFGYNKNGDFVPAYNSQFYSTLFNVNGSGRIAAYEKKYGTFKLASLSLGGGKTGTLGSGSNYVYSLVSFAKTADKSKTYICVTGETSGGSEVMKDAKTIYDNYIN